MIHYREALHAFPSAELLRKNFPSYRSDTHVMLEDLRTKVHMALFAPLAEASLKERVYIVRNNAIVWRAYTNQDGVRVRHTFTRGVGSDVELALIAELRVAASLELDMDGEGVVRIENDDIVFVPTEAHKEPTYGNILLFDPYHKIQKR
jgi:hypothetical protein